MTNAERARSRLYAALEAARESMRGDWATHRLLWSVDAEEAVVYPLLDYGSPGFILTVINRPEARAWRLTFLQLLEMDQATLSARLIDWVKSDTSAAARKFEG